MNGKDFYRQKVETLTRLRDTLQLALDDVRKLCQDEGGVLVAGFIVAAPAGDLSEIYAIAEPIVEAHRAVCALLEAVQPLAD